MTDPLPAVSQTVFGVPKSHRHCTFENFSWPSPGIQAEVLGFLKKIQNGGRGHLLVTGVPGTGKTHLAVAIYRWAVLQWGTMLSSLVQVPEFFHQVKATFDDKEGLIDNPFRDVEDARRLVILDDLLGRTPTPWEVDHVIFRLINIVYSNSASLIVTSNHTPDEMHGILKPHEVSRLLEGAVHLEFRGADRRL